MFFPLTSAVIPVDPTCETGIRTKTLSLTNHDGPGWTSGGEILCTVGVSFFLYFIILDAIPLEEQFQL